MHKTRELLVKQRTMSVTSLRGHLSEFGIITAKGRSRADELLELDREGGILLLSTLFGMFLFLKKLFAGSAYESPIFHTALGRPSCHASKCRSSNVPSRSLASSFCPNAGLWTSVQYRQADLRMGVDHCAR